MVRAGSLVWADRPTPGDSQQCRRDKVARASPGHAITMSEPIISVEHVFKSVTDSTGTLDILRDIDFALAPRETVAIVGASGSGKSTLLSIIAGLDTPTRGTVRLAGQDLFAIDEDSRGRVAGAEGGVCVPELPAAGQPDARWKT
jgi:putative ABC transport system ATP-binding protein